MLNFLQFEKTVGVRKLSDFIQPKILKQDEFILPTLSCFLYYGDLNKKLSPDDSDLIFRSSVSVRPRVFSLDTYGKGTIGKFKKLNIKLASLLTPFKKENPDFEYVLKRIKLGLTPANKLIIFNYGALNSLYRYSNYVSMDYDKYYNTIKTVVAGTHGLEKVSERVRYIHIELPHNLLQVKEYKKLLKVNGKRITEIFRDYRALNVFELYRLLQTDFRQKSPFSGLLNRESDDIVLVFTYSNKVTTCKLSNFLALNKDYEVESTINGYNSSKAGGVFLYYITQILNSAAASISELDQNSLTDVANKFIEANIKIDDEFDNLEESIDIFVKENTIDMSEIETEVKDKILTGKETDSVSNIKKSTPTNIELANNIIDEKTELGLIKPNVAEKQKQILKNQKDLMKSLEIDIKDLDIDATDIKIEDTLAIMNNSISEDPLKAIETKYLREFKDKNDKRMIYAMQNAGIVVEDHEIIKEKSILGTIDVHKIKVLPPGGRVVTLTIRMPHVDEDGRFKMNNNTYVMRKQKSDAPIRKISNTQVNLSSYYGKLMIRKATYKKDNIGLALLSELQKLNDDETSKVSLVVPGNIIITDVKLPNFYMFTSRNVRSFKIGNDFLLFDYIFRKSLIKDGTLLKDLEKGSMTLIGSTKGGYILMDKNNNLHSFIKGKITPLGSYLEFIGINVNILPVEYSMIKVLGQNIPTVLLLTYYLGFDQLLKTLNIEYKTFESKRKTTVDDGDYTIIFKDKVYVFNRKDELATMILSGFNYIAKHIRHIESIDLNRTSGVVDILVAMGLNRKYETEIKILKTMFVDPITKDILKIMKEPETFLGLLIKSNELLITDYAKPTNDISEILFKGYERMSGMLFHTLSRSVRDYENKHGTIKTKLSVNPYATWAMISEDSTVMLEDDLNPIASLKQKEDVTFTGFQGRSSETLNQASREYHESEVGILSEATKDSSEVGISVYTAAAPRMNNVLGVVDPDNRKIEELGFHNIFSTSTMLAPFSLQDD